MRYLVILLSCFSCVTWAIDDVFDDIPSQFEGINVFFGLLSDASVGLSEYDVYKYATPTIFSGLIEVAYQSEQDLWVSGFLGHLAIGPIEEQIFENNAANKIEIKHPIDVGVGYRVGFLFNPSTMLATNVGLGMAQEDYKEVGLRTDKRYVYFNTGVSMTLGVLTAWGVEMGLDFRMRNTKKAELLNGKKYLPAEYGVAGKFGLVYHREPV